MAKDDFEADDVLGFAMQDKSYEDIEELIDDMALLFNAGIKTTQATMANLIITMQFEPDEYKRLKDEIDPFMAAVKENLLEKMSIDDID